MTLRPAIILEHKLRATDQVPQPELMPLQPQLMFLQPELDFLKSEFDLLKLELDLLKSELDFLKPELDFPKSELDFIKLELGLPVMRLEGCMLVVAVIPAYAEMTTGYTPTRICPVRSCCIRPRF